MQRLVSFGFTAIVGILFTFGALAQPDERKWEVHPYAGFFAQTEESTFADFFDSPNAPEPIFGLRISRDISSRLSLEGSFAGSPAGRSTQIFIIRFDELGNQTGVDLIGFEGGSSFFFDFDLRVDLLDRKRRLNPFITLGSVLAIRTPPIDREAFNLIRSEDPTIFVSSSESLTENVYDGGLTVGGGFRLRINRSWGWRVEVRARQERRDFIDVLVGPTFRF